MTDLSLDLAAPMITRDDVSLAAFDLSDDGNSKRFIARHGDRFRFVRGQGWYVYTGTHWSREGADEAALLCAALTAASLEDESKALYEAAKLEERNAGDPAKIERWRKRAAALKEWRTTSGSINRGKGMLSYAAAALAADLEEFDREPLALNCENGTVRFIAGEGGRYEARLDPHNPADKITRICAAPYQPDARSTLWEDHLARMVPDVQERWFLARVLGYCASGLNREQVFFMLQGRGGDGKSVTIGAVRRALGSYAATADVKTFLEDKTGRSAAQASPDLARLSGATRLVSTSEPPRGSRLNEGLIKQFTGGAPLTARFLNRDPFEFIPSFKLILECNARPGIGGSDDGIWRRVHIMPWRVQLKRADMNPEMEMMLAREAPALIAWLARGLLAYLQRGLDPPASIEAAHADYKRGSNAFREWLETYCELVPDHVEFMAALYASYKDAMEAQGFEPMHQKSFGLALSDHQIMITSREGGTGKARRKGARLRSAYEVSQMIADADGALDDV